MKVLLDTALLSDLKLAELADEISRRRLSGDEFYVSVITHFQLNWGYILSRRPALKYETFLKSAGIEVIPLTKTDAETAAAIKPAQADVLDALIAASAKRIGATVWTTDKDFRRFLPKEQVRLVT